MSNKHRGYIDIELDKPRRLKYDWNAIAAFEDYHNTSLIEIMESIQNKKIGRLRLALWGGLIHEDESLTLKEVGNLMDSVDITYMLEKVKEALECSGVVSVSQKKSSGAK